MSRRALTQAGGRTGQCADRHWTGGASHRRETRDGRGHPHMSAQRVRASNPMFHVKHQHPQTTAQRGSHRQRPDMEARHAGGFSRVARFCEPPLHPTHSPIDPSPVFAIAIAIAIALTRPDSATVGRPATFLPAQPRTGPHPTGTDLRLFNTAGSTWNHHDSLAGKPRTRTSDPLAHVAHRPRTRRSNLRPGDTRSARDVPRGTRDGATTRRDDRRCCSRTTTKAPTSFIPPPNNESEGATSTTRCFDRTVPGGTCAET